MPIYRSPIINPQSESQCDFFKDGGLVVSENGTIEDIGKFDDIVKGSRQRVIEVADGVITPAFSDVHVHMPQNHVKGKFEDQLLPWLKECI